MLTPVGKPHLASLPSYIQLFHENGELRECDHLPLYTADESGLQATIPLFEPERSDCSIQAPSYESIIPYPSVFSTPSIPSSSTLYSASGAASASAPFYRPRSAFLSPPGISSSSDLDPLDEGERNLRGRRFSPASQLSDDDAMDLDGAGSGSAAGDSPSGARQGEEGILEGSMERLVRKIGVKRTGRGNPMLTPLVVRQVL